MVYTELSQLPAKEAAAWDAAHVRDDGKQRQVTRQVAGGSTTWCSTVEHFLEEVTDRLAHWRDGRYEIAEAAQVVADSNPAINAKTFCRQMEGAAYAGALTLRKNGVPLRVDELQRGGVWNMQVRQDDVNKWLHDIAAGFELTYPYAGNNAEPQAAPDAPVVAVPASVEVVKGIVKRTVMAEFNGLKWDYDHWGRNLASPSDKLKACRVALGSKTASALWSPVEIGLYLLDERVPLKKLDAVFVGLSDWVDEWRERTELLRD